MVRTSTTVRKEQKEWTVLSLIEWSSGYLADRGFDEGRLHVELMLAHVLQCSRVDLYLHFDRPLTTDELSAFKSLFQRRLNHEPLQYIVGQTNFMGLALEVSPGVLIPRPETELLVEEVVKVIRERNGQELNILDIGTGSGNIPIAIAHFSHVPITSIDISEEALVIARRNVEKSGLPGITLLHADVLSDVLPGVQFDIIVSNPPYVSAAEFAGLPPEIREFEPSIATTDGRDGLLVVTAICEFASHRLAATGMLFVEIGYGQAEQVRRLVADCGLRVDAIVDDYGGIPRIVKAARPS
jgi:release factor glutamine methyltransferase